MKRGLGSRPGAIAPWDWSNSGNGISPALRLKFIGNQKGKVYHRPGCLNGAKMSEANRVLFDTADAAERSGCRAGQDCVR